MGSIGRGLDARALAKGGGAAGVAGWLILVCLGCAAPPTPGPSGVVDRMIVTHPERRLSWEAVSHPVTVERLPVVSDSEDGPWRLERIRILRKAGPDGVCEAIATDNGPKLILDHAFDARDVSAIEVSGESLGPIVEVFWARQGERFSPDRSMWARPIGDKVTVDVFLHPLWDGGITRVRIDPVSSRDAVFRLGEIRMIRRDVNPSLLVEASTRNWVFTLGADTRPAIVTPDGRPRSWTTEAEPGDRIAVAFGRLAPGDDLLRLTVSATLPGGDVVTLLEEKTNAGADRWIERRLDLPVTKRSEVRIEFSASLVEPDKDRVGVPVWGAPRLIRSSDSEEALNILLISIDTLRPDHLSIYGYDRTTSPMIDSWATRRAMVFENAVASSPWTLPSHASMLSGLDPVRHGINYEVPPHRFPSVVEQLARNGYETIAFTGGGFMNPDFRFDTGFDSYRSWPPGRGNVDELEVHVGEALKWLENEPAQPFVAFFHTYEVHGPFRPRQPYFDRWRDPEQPPFDGVMVIGDEPVDEDDGFMDSKRFDLISPGNPRRPLRADETRLAVDLYDSGIAYADAQISRILEALEASGQADRTAVIITSDHGQGMGEEHEHGLVGHAYLYDFNLRVPLLIALPGVNRPGSRVDDQVRLVDVAATILDMAGIAPDSQLDGVSLKPFLEGAVAEVPDSAWSYAAKTNHGISVRLDNRWKYIFNNTAWTPPGRREQLFDLAADPFEAHDLGEAHPLIDELRGRTRNHLERLQMGLRVDILAPQGVTLSGVIEFDRPQNLLLSKVKGFDVPSQGVVPMHDGASVVSAVAFDTRRREEVSLVFEDVHTEHLRVVASVEPGAESFDLSVDVSRTGSPVWIVRSANGWSTSQAEPVASGPRLRLEWRNLSETDAGIGALLDPEVKAQLEALGYAR
jgi:arylsulfatase A-like enzyme